MLNKKQAKAILDLLKSKDLNTRPVLQHICIKDHKWYATDGYVLVGGTIKADDNKMVDWQTLERWYKLANAKDTLDLSELEADEMYATSQYPDIDRLFSGWSTTDNVLELRYNLTLISEACKLLDNQSVKIIPMTDGSISRLFFTTNMNCTIPSTSETLWTLIMGLGK